MKLLPRASCGSSARLFIVTAWAKNIAKGNIEKICGFVKGIIFFGNTALRLGIYS